MKHLIFYLNVNLQPHHNIKSKLGVKNTLDSNFYSGLRKGLEWSFLFWLIPFTKWNQPEKD